MPTLSTSFILRRAAENGTSVTIDEANTYVKYAVSTSPTTAPTSGWQDTVPTIPDGSYLWTKTVVTYSDGTSTTAYSVSSKGDTGTSVSIKSKSVTYAVSDTSAQPADSAFTYTTVPSVSQGQYLWSKTVITYSGDNGSTTAYSVSRIGSDGKSVAGHSAYLHLAYSTSADGKENFSTTIFDGATYLGTRVDEDPEDSETYSDYDWVKIKGEAGEAGESAWSVRLSPETLAFTANANGTITNGENNTTSKNATVSVFYGDAEASISALSVVSNSLVGISSSDVAVSLSNKTVGYTPSRTLVATSTDGTKKYVPATAGSASFKVSASYKDTDGVTHTVTDLVFALPFTCDVSTSWGELITNDETFKSEIGTVTNDVSGLKKSVSTIEQTASEIKLQVEQSTSRNNLIANSWLNMVSNSYGGTCARSVQLTKGTTYILSVEGRNISASRLRCFAYRKDWSELWSVDITETTLAPKTLVFTPTAGGTYYIGFYNGTADEVTTNSDGTSNYPTGYIHVRRVKLEVAQKVGDNYVATTWTESEQDVGTNNNLVKKIVFPDSETITGKDGSPVTAYKIKITSSTATYIDGGIANYPAGASSELTQLAAGEAYTLSFFAKASAATTIKSFLYGTTSDGTRTVCQGSINSDTTKQPSKLGDGEWSTSVGTEWQRVSITFTTMTTLPASYKLLVARVSDSATVYITDVKLELGGRWTNNAATPDDLLATGIDIKNRQIELTADNFLVRNNAGERTASIDSDGNLTVPTVRTVNKPNSAGHTLGNVIIHKNLVEIFGASFKVIEMGVDENDCGFIHFFNSSGRLMWGVENSGVVDYKHGIVVQLSNLRYAPRTWDDTRIEALINAPAGSLYLSEQEQADLIALAAENDTEPFFRYLAPVDDDGNITVADEANDLTLAETQAFDQRVFYNIALNTGNLISTACDDTLASTLLFDVAPSIADVDGYTTYKWSVHKIETSGDSKDMVWLAYELYYKVATA